MMQLYPDLAALPAWAAEELLGGDGFFSTPAWWRTVWEAGVPEGGTPVFALHGTSGAGVLLPLLRDQAGRLEALTNPYTCLYPIAAAPGADLPAAGRALARLVRGTPALRLDALDPADPRLAGLLQGARAGGLVPLRFDHFGNWREELDGRDWPAYLASRPGALRETIRRRLRAAERNAELSFALAHEPDAVEAAIAEYEAVYARSWKEPEPFPRFNPELMRQTAHDGTLRLAILRHGSETIAVQMWIVHQGNAAVLKLAHVEAFTALSPGTVLTAWTLRQLIANDRIDSIDFGRGDDPYKQLWATQRRQRIGVMLVTPWRPAGMAALLRHAAGRLRLRRPAPGQPSLR